MPIASNITAARRASRELIAEKSEAEPESLYPSGRERVSFVEDDVPGTPPPDKELHVRNRHDSQVAFAEDEGDSPASPSVVNSWHENNTFRGKSMHSITSRFSCASSFSHRDIDDSVVASILPRPTMHELPHMPSRDSGRHHLHSLSKQDTRNTLGTNNDHEDDNKARISTRSGQSRISKLTVATSSESTDEAEADADGDSDDSGGSKGGGKQPELHQVLKDVMRESGSHGSTPSRDQSRRAGTGLFSGTAVGGPKKRASVMFTNNKDKGGGGGGGLFGRLGTVKMDHASREELSEVKRLLLREIGHVNQRIHEQADFLDLNIRRTMEVVNENHNEQYQAVKNTLSLVFGEQDLRLQELHDELKESTQAMEVRLKTSLEATRESLQLMRTKDLGGLSKRVDMEIERVSVDLTSQITGRHLEMTGMLRNQEQALTDAAHALRERCDANQHCAAMLENRTCKIEALQAERDKVAHSKLTEISAGVDVRVEQLSSAVMELAQKCDELNVQTRSQSENQLNALEDTHGSRLASIEETLGGFEQSVAEAASVPTRRVEWVINKVSRHLVEAVSAQLEGDDLPEGTSACRTWRSPFFDAAGTHNLQLELQFLRPTAPGNGCDCALSLKGPKGLELVFKVFIGEMSVRCSHVFDGETASTTKRLSNIAEQVCCEEDTLRVSIEVIEAISTVERHAHHPEQLTIKDGSLNMPDSSVVAHRYLHHGTLEMVQEEVNRMRSRMTRRIEWRVEQATMLQRCFPEGESLCSSAFMAAGLEGLQLVFFPSGHTGTKEGYCSLFLFCPGGSVLRFWLSAGRQRREARISFEQPGFFGRTNFCRFENCVDSADDTVLLVLEIEEAQQTEEKKLSHGIASRPSTVGGPSRVDHVGSTGTFPDAGYSMDSAGVYSEDSRNVSSVVKLQRLPGKQGLEDIVQLPSIWTSKTPGDLVDVLEGYHKFSEMRPKPDSRLGSARRGMRSAPGSGGLNSGLNSAGTSKSDLGKAPPPWVPTSGPQTTPRTPGRGHKYAAYT